MIHGVAPAGARQEPEMSTAQRSDAALGLHLAKPAIVSGDDDVAGKHHFDADGEHDALDRGDERLAASVCEPEDVDVAFLEIPLLGLRTKKFRHVETGREIVALGTNR